MSTVFKIKGSGDSEYEVNLENMTCTCGHWKFRCSRHERGSEGRKCKHLREAIENYGSLSTSDGEDVKHKREIIDKIISELEIHFVMMSSLVERHEVCGSYRRGLQECGDLDFLLICNDPQSLNDYFKSMGMVILWAGDVKMSMIFKGVQVDFLYIPADSWVFGLLHFTGSKLENIRLRSKASKMGYTLNEYHLMGYDQRLNSEEEIYGALDEFYVKPQDR